jgi:hypothetical protein
MLIFETLVVTANLVTDSSSDAVGITVTGPMINPLNYGRFAKGDNFQVLSIGLIAPEGLTLSGLITQPNKPYFGLYGGELSTPINYFTLNIFSMKPSVAKDYIYILSENMDVSVMGLSQYSSYIRGSTGESVQNDFAIYLEQSNIYFSMIGLPSSLNNKVITIYPYIKIAHNFPLTRI